MVTFLDMNALPRLVGAKHNISCDPAMRAVFRLRLTAVKWFAKAADHGERLAAFLLAMMFHYGSGGFRNPLIGAKYCKKASEVGIASGIGSLLIIVRS